MEFVAVDVVGHKVVRCNQVIFQSECGVFVVPIFPD